MVSSYAKRLVARRRRRVVPKRQAGPKRRMMRKRVGMSGGRRQDYAKLTEAWEGQILTDVSGNAGYSYTHSLSQFQRAQEVAHAYKYYRCAKVELQFIPYANIANFSGTTATRLPQIYFSVDRVANQGIEPSENEMLERGITPKLFNKKFVFSYRPNLLQNIQMETNQPADGTGQPIGINLINAINSVPLFNKWLPTQQSFGFKANTASGEPQTGTEMVQPAVNPYALRYYGSIWLITQEGNNSEVALGDLITKVTWEFKGPRALATSAPTKQETVSQSTSSTTAGVVPNTQPTDYP